MVSKPTTLIIPHHLLRPEIVEWDVRQKHIIPEHRRQRYDQAATTPPTQSMTLFIPGFTKHLPALQPRRPDLLVVTVAQVFRHIHRHLSALKLPRAELDLYGQQRVRAETSCIERSKLRRYRGPFDEEFYIENMRGIDLVRGRTRFGGLVHQVDSQGANVWVVILERTPADRHGDNVHPVLSPGYLPWDMADPPMQAFLRVYGPGNGDVLEDKSILTKLRPHSITLSDICASWEIVIPTGMVWDVPTDPMSVREVLGIIHAAMNVRYSDAKWPWWDEDAATIAKSAIKKVRTSASGEINHESIDDPTTYLDTTSPSHRRFLGIWDDVDSNGQPRYTLLTQPSLRPVPMLHCTLSHGGLNWDIITNPICFEDIPGFDAPATHPGRRAMSLRIDFMPGEGWTIDIFKPRRTPFVTVGQVLFMIHELLVVDAFNISFGKLPPYLMYEIRTRAEMRGNWDVVDGYKRVDTLRGAFCKGLEHRISDVGEDEWKVCLGRPD